MILLAGNCFAAEKGMGIYDWISFELMKRLKIKYGYSQLTVIFEVRDSLKSKAGI